MPKRREEEYCPDCDELIDDCECDEEDDITMDDVNKFLDTTKKGLDVYEKLKKLSTPPSVNTAQIPYYSPKPVTHEDLKESQNHEQAKKNAEEKERKEHRKWKIDTTIKIVGIVVSAIVALVIGLKIFH